MKKLLFFACLLTFASCDGDGPPGPQGYPGPPGPKGDPGTANVIGTEHISLNVWNYDPNYKWYSSIIQVPEITNDIRDFGLVMVYQKLTSGSNPSWIPLPDTYANVTTNYDFQTGRVTIYSFNVDNTTPIAPTGMVVRIVIIPSSFRKANPNTNWNNYNEVEKLIPSNFQTQASI